MCVRSESAWLGAVSVIYVHSLTYVSAGLPVSSVFLCVCLCVSLTSSGLLEC